MKPALDPGSPAQASLSILQLPLSRSPAVLPDCAARRFAGLSSCPAWLPQNFQPEDRKSLGAKTARCSAALLGEPPIASRFAHRNSEELQEPRRATGRFHFRRLIPTDPKKNRSLSNCLPAEIGPLVTCRLFLPLRTFQGGRNRRPDHMSTMHAAPESRKQNFW